jgi:hypothetical protein
MATEQAVKDDRAMLFYCSGVLNGLAYHLPNKALAQLARDTAREIEEVAKRIGEASDDTS